jgi:probable rRNA maturation factor
MSVDGSTVLFGATPPHLEFSPQDKRALRRFARELERRVGEGSASFEERTTGIKALKPRRPVRFTCLITNDREMQRLNRDFLGHDYPTDVLSFPGLDGHGGLGDIAVSSERALEQAQEFGHAHVDEIRILMLHGVLHLTGMDHERDGGEMERAEERWRNEFGLPATLIARVAGGGRAK